MPSEPLATLLDEVGETGDLNTLESKIAQMRDIIGAQHLLYHWINTRGGIVGAGTYGESWRRHYINEDYQKHDPVVRSALSSFHPVQWSRLDWSPKRAKLLLQDAQDAQIGNHGVTVPIHGPNGQFAHFTATLNGTAADWSRFLDQHGRSLILMGHFFNEKAIELTLGAARPAAAELSPREIDALTFLAMGYTRGHAADTLGISEHTLRVYIESARSKLNALNTTHAIAQALKQGLLLI